MVRKYTKKSVVSDTVSEPIPPITKPPQKEKDILWYIKEVCGGKETFNFDKQEEADAFGKKVRENNPDTKKVIIDISYLTVRINVT